MRRSAEDYMVEGEWRVGECQIGWETEGEGFNFHHRDVRWVNVWGKMLNDVRLDHEDGKIIGDDD